MVSLLEAAMGEWSMSCSSDCDGTVIYVEIKCHVGIYHDASFGARLVDECSLSTGMS